MIIVAPRVTEAQNRTRLTIFFRLSEIKKAGSFDPAFLLFELIL